MYSPIRKINNEMKRNRFYPFSKRLLREVRLYNELEYDHWVLIETNLLINTYCEKPKKIIVSVAGEPVESIFDMWTKDAVGNEEFICIRKSSDVDQQNECFNKQAIKELYAQRIWCVENNKNHKLITEKDVRGNLILLSNKKLLFPYYIPLSQLNPKLLQLIMDIVGSNTLTIRQLEKAIPSVDTSTIRNYIYALVYHGILKTDLEKSMISAHSEVHANV